MLTPFASAYTDPNETAEAHVPEVVPIEELTAERIEAAEAEIEAEEAWQQTG